MLRAEAHIGVGGQVEHKFGARHGLGQGGSMQGIALDEGEMPGAPRGLRKQRQSGREIIETDHLMAGG